jgi:DNA-binding NtrC family response regulator
MKIKLLLVDDEKDFVEVLSERLEVRGFDVKTALSGEEALKWIYRSEFDIVLLDVMISGDSGIEILAEIKRAKPHVQIIMLTGHAKIDAAVRGIELGAYDYLLKPLEIEPLVEKIKMAYDYKSAQQKRARQEETRRGDKKRDRRRFFSAIYDFVYGSRRDHRSKSQRIHKNKSKER